MKNYNVSQIKNLILGAKTALIAVPQLSVDSLGSALALALVLKKSNIKSQVFCPHKTDTNYSKLSGLDLVTENYNPNDLTISLNYPLDQIENVSYNNDNDRLNLIIKTKINSPKVENNQIVINNQSAIADVCFILGDESGLGNSSSIVSNGNWVFISPTNLNKTWAKASIIDQDAPFSEIFSFLIPALGFKLDLDSAKNLLIGLRVTTQSFSVNVSPETFEAGALCLRATQPENNIQNNQSVNNQSNNSNSFDNFTPIESVESKPNNQFNSSNPSSLPTA